MVNTLYTQNRTKNYSVAESPPFCPDSCTTWHLLQIPGVTDERGFEFFHGEASPIYDKVVELYEKQEEERKRIKQVSDAQEKINTRKHALAKIDSLIAR